MKPTAIAALTSLLLMATSLARAEASEPEAASVPKVSFEAAPGQGMTVRAGDAFSMNVRARAMLRYQLDIPERDAAGERELSQLASVATARLWFSGHILVPELTYMIQLAVAPRDFRDGTLSPIYDAYLDYRAHRDFNVRVGQFFVPFDRLRTVREWALQMGERPVPVTELTLDRDVGVMLYSDSFLGDASPVAVRLGAFGGNGPNVMRGKPPGGLLVGRLELRPLGAIDDDVEGDLQRRARPALALGGGFAQAFNSNRQRSTTGTTFTGGTTNYTQFAVDLVFKWRGAMLQAEYLWRNASVDTIHSQDAEGAPVTEHTQSGRGYVLQASYTFAPPFELVGRLSGLDALAGTSPSFAEYARDRGQELAFGANYYVNGHKLKVQADWIAKMPHGFVFERAAHVIHVQVDATF